MRTRPLRPLMYLCVLYVLTLGCFFLLTSYNTLKILVAAIISFSFLLLLFLPKSNLKPAFCIAAIIVVFFSFFRVDRIVHEFQYLQSFPEQVSISVTGTVLDLDYATDNFSRFTLRLDSLDGQSSSACVLVESSGDAAYYAEPGDRVACSLFFSDDYLTQSTLDLVSDFSDQIFAHAILDSDKAFDILGHKNTLSTICGSIAQKCKVRLYSLLDQDTASFASALMLGDKSNLSAEVKRDFRRIGTSHYLAISGVHISILVIGLQFLFSLLQINKRYQMLLLILVILLFMGMTGFSASVMRAGIMWIICCVLYYWGGQRDTGTVLFLAMAVICVFVPVSVADVGLLLSVSATLGIFLLGQPTLHFFDRVLPSQIPLRKLLCSIISVVSVTVSATVFTLPITMFVFGEISLFSIPANLFLYIPITLLLYLIPCLFLTSQLPQFFVTTFLCSLLASFITLVTNVAQSIASVLSHFDYAVIGLRHRFVIPIFLIFFILTVILCIKRKQILFVYPMLVLFCIVFALCLRIDITLTRDQVAVTYQVYKKNDIVTVISDQKGILIDTSDGAYTSSYQGWQTLSRQNITELEAVILTHYHKKHTASLTRLSESVLIRNLLIPVPLTDDEREVRDALTAALGKKLVVSEYKRGVDQIQLGNAEIFVFDRAMLSRSTQPLIGYTVSASEDQVLYLEAASFEEKRSVFSDQYSFAMHEADYFLLGIHGPTVRVPFTAEFFLRREGSLNAILSSHEKLHELVDVDLRTVADTVISLEDNQKQLLVLH